MYSADELQADVARGSGCQLDRQLVWTSSACGDDPSHFLIAMGRSSAVRPRCFDASVATRTAGVRCCSERRRTPATRTLQHADDLFGFDAMASGDETTPEQSPKSSRVSKTAVVATLLGLTVGLLILAGLALRGSRKLRAARCVTTATDTGHSAVPSEFTSIVAGSWDEYNTAFADTALDHPIKIMAHADQANPIYDYAERSPRRLTLSETMIAAVIAECDAVYSAIGTDPEPQGPVIFEV